MRAHPPPHAKAPKAARLRARPERSGRRQLFWLVGGVILVSGVVLVLTLVSLRAQALRTGGRLTESFAHIIAEETDRTLRVVDLRLQLAVSHVKQAEAAGRLDEFSGRELLREEIKELPFVRALSVADARGRVIYSSDAATPGWSVADRAYFGIHRDNPLTGFHVGLPVRGRVSGSWLISGTRALPSAGGAFAGLIVAAVDPAYFDQLWDGVDLGEDGSIALFRGDGVLMMRSPLDDAVMGRNFGDRPLFRAMLPAKPAGSFQDTSPFDGVARVLAYRTLSAHPELVVVVGRSHDLMLAPWRQLAGIALSIWSLACMVILALGAWLNRSWLKTVRSEASGEEMAQRLVLATDAASVGVWDWDLKADRWYGTPTYFAMLGYEPDQGIRGRQQWLDHLHPDDRDAVAANIEAALAGTDVPYRHDARVLHADGTFRWVSVIGRVLARDEAGVPSRLLGVMMDITERTLADEALRNSIREKEALLREVHHRVKNNLQVITSLLRLESTRTREPGTRDVLKEMQGRIRSMSLLHETLYRTGKFARVDLADYLRQLANQLFRAQNTAPGEVRLELDLRSVVVDIDQAIPCGLIVNELLTNCLKHAFGEGGGEVRVRIGPDEVGRARLEVSDSGRGLPLDFETRRGASLGLQLVSDLARQLGGTLEIGPESTPRFAVTFTLRHLETGPIVLSTG